MPSSFFDQRQTNRNNDSLHELALALSVRARDEGVCLVFVMEWREVGKEGEHEKKTSSNQSKKRHHEAKKINYLSSFDNLKRKQTLTSQRARHDEGQPERKRRGELDGVDHVCERTRELFGAKKEKSFFFPATTETK